jgi:hypothetical protein
VSEKEKETQPKRDEEMKGKVFILFGRGRKLQTFTKKIPSLRSLFTCQT